jgi:tRNA pseudouridine38-40 synthase
MTDCVEERGPRRDGPPEGFVRVRLDLSYDGTGFSGWAKQKRGERTVQEELEDAIRVVLRRPEVFPLTVAGRTDAGVHARGQVAHVDLPGDVWSAEGAKLRRRLAGKLSDDIRVWRVAQAPEGFEARFSAIWRRYAYRVCDHPAGADPLRRNHVLWHDRPLDVDAMNEAAGLVLGEHDFAAYCKKRQGATTIRELLDFRWERQPGDALLGPTLPGLVIGTVRADAFCHNMVRALVGSMLLVGGGLKPVSFPAQVLAGKVRHSAVNVVRPWGLTLEEVGYPADADLAARSREARNLRVLEPR